QRRLDLTRGGPITQRMQKEVLVRLDEMIKEKENQQRQQQQQQQQGQQPNDGNCPPGGGPPGLPSGNRPQTPAGDSARPSAPPQQGEVDPAAVQKLADVWGNLPEKERAKAMLELTRGLDPKYRDAIEMYIKELARRSGGDGK